MRKILLLLGTLILITFVIVSCGGDKNPTTSTNKAPGQLTLNSPAGTPANGAIGVLLTPTLRWLCIDPDGDVLTYTVSFGLTTPPPVVSTDQSVSTYSPTSLTNSTKYYWSVTAKDPSGASSSSVVWNFTTLNASVETITTPAVPSGPATGYENQDLSYSAHGSISSSGDGVEYRFDWGDSSFSDWSATAIQNSWGVGTYQVKTQARCVNHPTIVSKWSTATTVTITVFALETVSTPDVPGGPIIGEENQSLRFTTSGAVSSYSDDVQYRFDWGDGTISSWYNYTVSPTHIWSTVGTYVIKTQARCITHTTIESDWSADKTVTISVATAETVSAPDAPTAPDSGTTDVNLIITNNGGAVSSYGHYLEYRYDFGDGQMSNWYYNNTTIQHNYTIAGTYNIAMQARCRTHTTIESDWSTSNAIIITDPPEVIPSPPTVIIGVEAGAINEPYTYTVAHSSNTNLGNPVEGRFDWGDGTFSNWITVYPFEATYTWSTEGTYVVRYQARSSVNTNITADSDSLVVTITSTVTETVAIPGYINWQDAQDRPMLDTETIYYAYGGLSSLGHDTESRIAWGDGDTTGWVAMNTQIFKTWTVLGTFSLTRQSRCIAHPDIISEWSETSYIITGPESVSAPDAPPGPTTGTKNYPVYFLGTGAESSWHSYSWLSYRFAWGDGDTTAWRDRLDTLVGHNYSVVGDFEVTVQAKCVWPGHTNPISEWSLPSVVNIIESITFNENVNGPVEGPINQSLTFDLSSPATSSEGHDMEYRFAFGDGDTSLWAPELTASHAYTTAGRYSLKAQARCATHHEAITEWPTTYFHWIDITDDPETISLPTVDAGVLTTIGDSTVIRVERSTSSFGDSLEYQIDYGDGTLSGWFPTSWYSSGGGYWRIEPEWTRYVYAAVGSYNVRGRARCVAHPTVITDWSVVTYWNTAVILEAVSMPATPTGPETGVIGENMTFTTTGSTSSEGHQLEYTWSYRGPENQYTDYTTSLTDTKVFSVAGEHYVYLLVRCVEHTDAQNGWSEKFYFTITE